MSFGVGTALALIEVMRQSAKVISSDLVEIEGLVLPTSWDEMGTPSGFKISSPGELSYLIVDDNEGQKLRGLLRNYVRLLGRVQSSKNGELKIVVEQVLRHE